MDSSNRPLKDNVYHKRILIEVFILNREYLYTHAKSFLKDSALAEDVLQDAVLKICQLSPDTKIVSPVNYLRRMVRNISIDYIRKRDREKSSLNSYSVLNAITTSEMLIFCSADRLNEVRLVKSALAGLSVRTRYVFLLHRIRGVPQNELARNLNLSTARINQYIRAGDALCRAALTGIDAT